MNSAPFDPNQEFYKWGPIPGRYLDAAGDCLESFFLDLPQKYGYVWPDSLWLLYEGRMIWLTPFKPIWDEGIQVFNKYMLDDSKRIEIYNIWQSKIEELQKYEAKIDTTNLPNISDQELKNLIKNFNTTLIAYWTPSFFQEIGNYGAEQYLEKELFNLLKDKGEVLKAMEIITAPEEFSFYQQEEIDLLKTNDLAQHQQKYFWLRNSHNNIEILPIEYFAERKKKLLQNLEDTLKINLDSSKKRKVEIQQKYGFSAHIMKAAGLIGEGMVWQDVRKKNTFLTLHYKDVFVNEVSKRTDIAISDLYNFTLDELAGFLDKETNKDEIEKRRKAVGVYCTQGKIEQLEPEEVKRLWKFYLDPKKLKGDIKELKGTIASVGQGLVVGKVRILLDPMEDFEEGDVLVTTLTSPDYVFAMRKAIAIVTDTGGVGSHAAIVSRELNKPCIVGTNIATQVLKDGDEVEVDTSNGIVRILN